MGIGTVKWSSDLSVGIPEVDEDHKKLISLLNNLFSACFAGVGDEAVEATLEALTQYTLYHFRREEILLEQLGSTQLEEHCHQHRELIQQIDKITQQGLHALSEEVLYFLRDWVTQHIQQEDKAAFSPYIKASFAP